MFSCVNIDFILELTIIAYSYFFTTVHTKIYTQI